MSTHRALAEILQSDPVRDHQRIVYLMTAYEFPVAVATRDMFLDWFLPRALHQIGEPVIYSLMDDRLLDAFHFPKPPSGMRHLVEGFLRFRSRIVRRLSERSRPRMRSEMRHRTYPDGYLTEELGPPPPG